MNTIVKKKYSCLVCNTDKLSLILHLESFPLYFGALPKNHHNALGQYPLKVAICEECGLVQQIDRVNESIMNKIYEADYYNCPSPTSSGMGISEIEKFYKFFNNVKIEKGKLLEIGCFDGYLLDKFQKDGWEVYGIDPSSATANILENFHKEHIKNSFFDKKSFPDCLFDVIVFRNLLEHIYTPNAFLKSVKNNLNKNGIIFIDLPNLKALNEAGGIGSFFHQHISYFSIDSMRFFLARHGFNIIDYYEGSPNLFICAKKERLKLKKLQKTNIDQDIYFIAKKIKEKINKINILVKANENVALFGASLICTTIINSLDHETKKKIKYIFDNDISKFGRYIFNCNIPIQAPRKINDTVCDIVLILTWIFSDKIIEQLLEMGYSKQQLISISEL